MESTKMTQEVDAKERDEKMTEEMSASVRNELQGLIIKNKIEEEYPWLREFRTKCKDSLAQWSGASLKQQMIFFTSNLNNTVDECFATSKLLDSLKDTINEALFFFMCYYRESHDKPERRFYMDLMSDILALYIETEINASKIDVESKISLKQGDEISSRICSHLNIYLQNSAEHLLETILKVRLLNEKYQEILHPVIKNVIKIANELESHPRSSIMFVRYLLVYRLWKKLHSDTNARSRISMCALETLGAAPPEFSSFVGQFVLPKASKTKPISVSALLDGKFDTEKSRSKFVNFCKNQREPKKAKESASLSPVTATVPEDTDKLKSKDNLVKNSIKLDQHNKPTANSLSNILDKTNQVESSKPAANPIKNLLRKPKRFRNVVLIDLTNENISEQIIKPQKPRRKLTWLVEVAKRLDAKMKRKKNIVNDQPQQISTDARLKDSLETARIADNSPFQSLDKNNTEELPAEESTHEDSPPSEDSHPEERTTRPEDRAPTEDFHDPFELPPSSVFSSQEILNSIDEYCGVETEIQDTPKTPPIILESTSTNVIPESTPRLTVITRDETRHLEKAEPDKRIVQINSPLPKQSSIKAEYINADPPEQVPQNKILFSQPSNSEQVEFRDNTDGLSLLASVSQCVSHLTTTSPSPQIPTNSGELIKVKNYATLSNANAYDVPAIASQYSSAIPPDATNKVTNLYHEDTMDKVALQIEVTATEEISTYPTYQDPNTPTTFPSNSEEINYNCQLPIDPATPQTDDTNPTKPILSGETVVLFQKSPNSNLYIINKAVGKRGEVSDDETENVPYNTYEMYENVYRGKPYDLSEYSRELSSQENRRKVKIDTAGEPVSKVNDTIEMSGINVAMSMESMSKVSPSKRKSPSTAGMSRRLRIRHDFNGHATGHINASYGIPDSLQERGDTPPLASIYPQYQTGADIYMPFGNNYNALPCVHAHPNQNCSCLNCRYGIPTHCSKYMMSNGDNHTSTIENPPYYMPIHTTVQTSAVQDCSRTSGDDQIVFKLEQKVIDSKPLENNGVKFDTRPICRSEFDAKLPLKKRFKSMVPFSYEDTSINIDNEKIPSYPGTLMMSIAALEGIDTIRTNDVANNTRTMDVGGNSVRSKNELQNSSYTREMIRRDYRKEMVTMMIPTNNSNGILGESLKERKNKRQTIPRCTQQFNDNENGRYETGSQKIKSPVKRKESIVDVVSRRLNAANKVQVRGSDKVKEIVAEEIVKPKRQTRSSKRKMPKANYTDADSDWNPSGESKKKRKKTAR